jgi:hypothetical protein
MSLLTVNQLAMINLSPRAGRYGDCVVKALTFITGKIYGDIEETVMREQPRFRPDKKTGQGCNVLALLRSSRRFFGFNFASKTHFPIKMTLNEFVFNHKQGTYLMCIPGHAFVVRDGEVFDACETKWNARITWVYEATIA